VLLNAKSGQSHDPPFFPDVLQRLLVCIVVSLQDTLERSSGWTKEKRNAASPYISSRLLPIRHLVLWLNIFTSSRSSVTMHIVPRQLPRPCVLLPGVPIRNGQFPRVRRSSHFRLVSISLRSTMRYIFPDSPLSCSPAQARRLASTTKKLSGVVRRATRICQSE
jgi:hypothetical protein